MRTVPCVGGKWFNHNAKHCGPESEPQVKDRIRGTAASAGWGDFGQAYLGRGVNIPQRASWFECSM